MVPESIIISGVINMIRLKFARLQVCRYRRNLGFNSLRQSFTKIDLVTLGYFFVHISSSFSVVTQTWLAHIRLCAFLIKLNPEQT